MLLMAKSDIILPAKTRNDSGWLDFRWAKYTASDGTELDVVDLPWCRELASDWTRQIAVVLRSQGNVLLDLHGARSHSGYGGGYERKDNTTCVHNKRKAYVDATIGGMFNIMFNILDILFLPEQPELTTTDLKKWAIATLASTAPKSCTHTAQVYLNDEGVRGITGPKITEKQIPYGSITGISRAWLESRAVFSYLVYTLRLWGDLYRYNLTGLVNRYVVDHTKATKELLGLSNESSAEQPYRTIPIQLWLGMMHGLFQPFWFFRYGRETYWAMTYYLCDLAVAKLSGVGVKTRLEELRTSRSNGFNDFILGLSGRGGNIGKVMSLFDNRGVSFLVPHPI